MMNYVKPTKLRLFIPKRPSVTKYKPTLQNKARNTRWFLSTLPVALLLDFFRQSMIRRIVRKMAQAITANRTTSHALHMLSTGEKENQVATCELLPSPDAGVVINIYHWFS